MKTVDGGTIYRPRFTGAILTVILLAIFLAGCRFAPPSVTLALLGDLMLGRGVDPKPESLAYIASQLKAADLALANLESPFAHGETFLPSTNIYNLCTSAVRADLLPAWGFDLLSIANNHSLDCGPQDPTDTVLALTAVGIMPTGPSMEPVYMEVNGLPLAFLAFDDISVPLNANNAVQAIQLAHANGALVVVSIHWGAEYQGGASESQEALAQQFAEAGAVLIWGHHPHILQPAQWIETSQGKTLVLYSLGNTLFDQGGLADTRQSALVMVTLDVQGVKSTRSVPFVIDVVNSRVNEPDEETARKIQQRLNIP